MFPPCSYSKEVQPVIIITTLGRMKWERGAGITDAGYKINVGCQAMANEHMYIHRTLIGVHEMHGRVHPNYN